MPTWQKPLVLVLGWSRTPDFMLQHFPRHPPCVCEGSPSERPFTWKGRPPVLQRGQGPSQHRVELRKPDILSLSQQPH